MKSIKTTDTAPVVVPPAKGISGEFYARIRSILESARRSIVTTVNKEMVQAY